MEPALAADLLVLLSSGDALKLYDDSDSGIRISPLKVLRPLRSVSVGQIHEKKDQQIDR